MPLAVPMPDAMPSQLAGDPGRPSPAYGPWRAAIITDVGRPFGRPFQLKARAFYREILGADPWADPATHHVLLPGIGAPAARRWVTQTQLDGATAAEAGNAVGEAEQARLSAEWDRLEPKPAGNHPGTRIPLRWRGMDTRLTATNPEVAGPGWQGDTVPGAPGAQAYVIVVEAAVWAMPPAKPPPEVDEAQIRDLLEHEAVEFEEKERIVDMRWPQISAADRARCFDELEGPAHVRTIGIVEGYYGPDAERRYLKQNDYRIMRERGFGRLVDQWERTDR